MGSEQHVQLWDRCLTIIKDNINEEAFDSLFKPIVSLGFDDNVLTLLVPSHFVIEQIEEHYLSLLKGSASHIWGKREIVVSCTNRSSAGSYRRFDRYY